MPTSADLLSAGRALALTRDEIDRRTAGGEPDERYDPILDALADLLDEVEP